MKSLFKPISIAILFVASTPSFASEQCLIPEGCEVPVMPSFATLNSLTDKNVDEVTLESDEFTIAPRANGAIVFTNLTDGSKFLCEREQILTILDGTQAEDSLIASWFCIPDSLEEPFGVYRLILE